MSAMDYLAGRKILAEVDSPVNGKITVVKELAWGTYIKVGGLPQSGGLAKTIWETSLKVVKKTTKKNPPQSVLVLGFAGGGIAQISRDYWPECEIYGVDIDPLMVDLGRQYLKWEETGAKVWIQDATEFISEVISTGKPTGEFVSGSLPSNYQLPATKFDLICVDMYVGDGVPKKFNTVKFVKSVKKLIADDGMAVFNRLYGSGNEELASEFNKTLEKVFPNIKIVYPDANVMFLCGK